jgi:hypothetical protein
VRRGVATIRQTGQVQTPSPGSRDREIVYLADSGGHTNLWLIAPDTLRVRCHRADDNDRYMYEDPDAALP